MSIEFFQVDHETGKINSRPCPKPCIKNIFTCTKCNIFFEVDKQLILHMHIIHKDRRFSEHIEAIDAENYFQGGINKNEQNQVDSHEIEDVNLTTERTSATIQEDSEDVNASKGGSSNSTKEKFTCLICGRNFLSRISRNSHVTSHLEIIPSDSRSITDCGKKAKEIKTQLISNSFKRTQNRLSNLKTASAKSSTRLKRKINVHNHTCTVCSTSYGSYSDLQRHFRTKKHQNAVPSQRKISKQASSKSENNLRNKKCNKSSNCLKTETDSTSCNVLDDSSPPSTAERINCDVCNKNFKSIDTLTRHRETVHMSSDSECQALFTCKVCDGLFLWDWALTQHMKSHE